MEFITRTSLSSFVVGHAGFEYRNLDSGCRDRLAHDYAGPDADHGVIGSDGDEPSIFPVGVAIRRARRCDGSSAFAPVVPTLDVRQRDRSWIIDHWRSDDTRGASDVCIFTWNRSGIECPGVSSYYAGSCASKPAPCGCYAEQCRYQPRPSSRTSDWWIDGGRSRVR